MIGAVPRLRAASPTATIAAVFRLMSIRPLPVVEFCRARAPR